MARKKTEKKTVTTVEDQKTRPVRLDLPADVHRLLRLLAADEEVSMAAYARDHLESLLRDQANKKGFKQ